jgi:hypothetical protein
MQSPTSVRASGQLTPDHTQFIGLCARHVRLDSQCCSPPKWHLACHYQLSLAHASSEPCQGATYIAQLDTARPLRCSSAAVVGRSVVTCRDRLQPFCPADGTHSEATMHLSSMASPTFQHLDPQAHTPRSYPGLNESIDVPRRVN